MREVGSQSESTIEPAEIAGYRVDRPLAGGQSYLAVGPGGREVVLKRLDPDCLFNGKLHASIHDRLSRVRELAHPGVANLHGVVRQGEQAYLVWEYVAGKTLDQRLAEQACSPQNLLFISRELLLSVDSLHMRGIVHGAISGSNVLVLPDDSLRLTHISPLLYTETAVDVEAVIGLLNDAMERRGEQTPLPLLLVEAARDKPSLRELGAKVAGLLDSRQRAEPGLVERERHIRRRALVGALLVALLGIAIGLLIWRAMGGGSDLHWLF